MDPKIAIVLMFVGFAVAEMLARRFIGHEYAVGDDRWVEIIGSGLFVAFTQPFVILSSVFLAGLAAPQYAGALEAIPWWAALALFLILDDMVQYWWHRASHTWGWLYNLHRAHHNAEYMSIRIVYRNNFFYYLFMPNLWLSGVLVYLGLGWFYIGYSVVKMAVIFGAHSNVRWDAPLYKIKWLSPVMWVVERTISTPATHSAHHGKWAGDGITHYKGNFGNLLFFWDVLFGTAKITRQYPERFGVENLDPVRWPHQLFWPVIREKSAHTAVPKDDTVARTP